MLHRQHVAKIAEWILNSDAAKASRTEQAHGSLHPVYIVLDNLRSVFNVGSIFRTAETVRLPCSCVRFGPPA